MFTSEDLLNQRGIWFYAGSLYRGFVILGLLYRVSFLMRVIHIGGICFIRAGVGEF